MRCLVGLDDTDSRYGNCTTHLGFQIISDLTDNGCRFSTYPRLVRLNPNIPFKTRGNAAVCLEFDTDDEEGAFAIAERAMRRLSDVSNGANSGLVFLDRPAPGEFRKLYTSAVSGVVSHRRVKDWLAGSSIRHVALGNGMGLVGAAASLGFSSGNDHTYELIAYRRQSSCGRPRLVEADTVKAMELATFPHTFNSYDPGTRRVLITPHGPDPVFLGIRADSPGVALAAFRMVRFDEPLAGHVIYLTNQCTDAHLGSELEMPMKAYSSGSLIGSVSGTEKGAGGHLYLDLVVGESVVRSAIYKPSANLQRAASMLEPGDEIRVFGGVRRATSKFPAVVNVEKIEVLSLSRVRRSVNPTCAKCGRTAKSEGSGKGFQCRKCGDKFAPSSRRVKEQTRALRPGIYLPSPGAQRHLTKPLIRYGRETHERNPLIRGWFAVGPSESSRAPARSQRSNPPRPQYPPIL